MLMIIFIVYPQNIEKAFHVKPLFPHFIHKLLRPSSFCVMLFMFIDTRWILYHTLNHIRKATFTLACKERKLIDNLWSPASHVVMNFLLSLNSMYIQANNMTWWDDTFKLINDFCANQKKKLDVNKKLIEHFFAIFFKNIYQWFRLKDNLIIVSQWLNLWMVELMLFMN